LQTRESQHTVASGLHPLFRLFERLFKWRQSAAKFSSTLRNRLKLTYFPKRRRKLVHQLSLTNKWKSAVPDISSKALKSTSILRNLEVYRLCLAFHPLDRLQRVTAGMRNSDTDILGRGKMRSRRFRQWYKHWKRCEILGNARAGSVRQWVGMQWVCQYRA